MRSISRWRSSELAAGSGTGASLVGNIEGCRDLRFWPERYHRWLVICDTCERSLDHLLGGRIAPLLLADAPFARLADTQPLQRRVGIGCKLVLVMRIDRVGVAGMLEDLGALDAAPDGAGIERAL